MVSSTVRSSADLFKTRPSERTRSRRQRTDEPPAAVPPASSTPRNQPDVADVPPRSERPRRYWRDSLAGSGAAASAAPRDDDSGDDGDGGGRPPIASMFGGGGNSRFLIGAIVAAIVVLVAIVLLINQFTGGDDDDPSPTATATLESVLETQDDDTGDGPDQPPGTPPDGEATEEPSSDPTEEATEEIRRGGDNQRGDNSEPDSDDEEESTPEASSTDEASAERTPPTTGQVAQASPPAGSVAQSCPETCLVQIRSDADLAELFTAAGTRPSFSGTGWHWLVASTSGIATLETGAPVELLAADGATTSLYVVTVPEGVTDDAAVAGFGTVLAGVDRARLVQVGSIPAQVSPLTDAGYAVEKFRPGLLPSAAPQEVASLVDVDIGSLMSQVSPENIEATIRDLQATSSTDGTSIGTRYYTQPGNVMASEYLFQRLESYGLKVWYEDFLSPEGLLLTNVVGEVPGRDPSAIYGVLSHHDSVAQDAANAPGADDNATGVAASLEIGRILAGYELRYPVRVIFVNAEEVGILGADAFARRAVAEGIPYEGIFNIDAVGSNRQGTLIVLNSDANSAWMQDLIVRVNESYGLGQELLPRQNPNIVADDNRLRDQGIEAVMVSRELYGWSVIHHTPDDVIDLVSIENTTSTTQLILVSMAALVQ